MFERFTDRARRVVVLAQEEARMLNHNYIGTEHFLLGLAHEGQGVAVKALESLDVSLEAVRQRVEEIIGQGQTPPTGHIPFTPRAKKILEFSMREATQLGHNYIGTEHILLGMLREGEGVACQILVSLGVDLNKVRQVVVQLLSGYEGRRAVGAMEPLVLDEPASGAGGWVGRRVSTEPAPPTAMPLCPSCRTSLDGNLGSRILEVEGGTPRRLFVAYCTTCGVALETRIEEPGA